MGNSSRPGTVVIREIGHDAFEVNGDRFRVIESVWNGIAGRSFDLVRCNGDEVLTDESFDTYPTDTQIAITFQEHGIEVSLEMCKMCQRDVLQITAHSHGTGWVGSCCWDERLRMTS
ncbi:hypothetical protein GCM10009578_091920 [Streptomyces rhizosphaericus]